MQHRAYLGLFGENQFRFGCILKSSIIERMETMQSNWQEPYPVIRSGVLTSPPSVFRQATSSAAKQDGKKR